MLTIKTEGLIVDPHEPEEEVVRHAAKVIEMGGLVVLPTDTVYGLVCDFRNREAVQAVYRVKKRAKDLPLILLLHDMGQVSEYVEDIPELAARAMQAFWPGPLTVVLREQREATRAVRAKKDTLGLRLPAHMVPRAIAERFGAPLASTSANPSGHPPATTAQQVADHLAGQIHLILDGGLAPLAQESTIVSFAGTSPRMLREGAITEARLREVLGDVEL